MEPDVVVHKLNAAALVGFANLVWSIFTLLSLPPPYDTMQQHGSVQTKVMVEIASGLKVGTVITNVPVPSSTATARWTPW